MNSNDESKKEIKNNVDVLYGTQLEYVIDGLELDTTYEFQVIAQNILGQSIPSEMSEKISLGIFLIIINHARCACANSRGS